MIVVNHNQISSIIFVRQTLKQNKMSQEAFAPQTIETPKGTFTTSENKGIYSIMFKGTLMHFTASLEMHLFQINQYIKFSK